MKNINESLEVAEKIMSVLEHAYHCKSCEKLLTKIVTHHEEFNK